MKNAILMGLTAAVLFAISAGLSLWLNHQGKPVAEAASSTEKTASRKNHQKEKESSDDHATPPRPLISLPTGSDISDATRLAEQLQTEMLRNQKREEELLRQQEMYRFALEDIRQEMLGLQLLWKKTLEQPPAEAIPSKPTTAPPPTLPMPPNMPPVSKPNDTTDPKAVGAVKGISESMAPDAAAKLLEQMARSGKIDTAAVLLTKLSPRQAAKILAAISDEQLSQQIFEKMMEVKQP
jgi:flagellar motility protein MotE (MotC chaperone)